MARLPPPISLPEFRLPVHNHMKNPVIIRPAGPSDLDSLAGLLGVLFSIEQDFRVDRERQRRGLELLLASRIARVLVAEAHTLPRPKERPKDQVDAQKTPPGQTDAALHHTGMVVGMVTGQLLISTAEGSVSLLVEDLVVAKKWRQRGIGRQLLAQLTAWGEARGAARLQLLADHTNQPALDFYENLGWQSTRMICLHKLPSPPISATTATPTHDGPADQHGLDDFQKTGGAS